MTDPTQLRKLAPVFAERAYSFLAGRLEDRRAWRTEADAGGDFEAQVRVAHALIAYSKADCTLVHRAACLLEACQGADGAWGPAAHVEGHVVPTAYALLALSRRRTEDAQARRSAERGRRWLEGLFSTEPTGAARISVLGRAVSLAALASLSRPGRAHGGEDRADVVGRLAEALSRAQQADGQWIEDGSQAKIDPLLTARVLFALRVAGGGGTADLGQPGTRAAIRTLAEDQNPDGSWPGGPGGIPASPQSTAAVCLELLERAAHLGAAYRGLEWLIENQEEDGGWQHDPRAGAPVSRRATQLALIALDRFLWRRDAPEDPGEQHEGPAPAGEDELYTLSITESWHGLPKTRPLDHTMFRTLDAYAEAKLPVQAIDQVLLEGGQIEIHGIYPLHFPRQAPRLGLGGVAEVECNRKPDGKKFNHVRPKFFQAKRGTQPVLAAAVVPGRDYFFHYATMVRHYVHKLTEDPERAISLARYPLSERMLAGWTGFDGEFISSGDRVLLGYVEALARLLDARGTAERLGSRENDCYGSLRYRLPDGSVLNLLGVKYSYWGSLSATLVDSICQHGAAEVLYLAKLGTLSSPDHIYSKVFVPDTFYTLHHNVVVNRVRPSHNNLLERQPDVSTGVHVSIPTVLEEDYRLRETASQLGAQSIDNEISQMAEAVAIYNAVHGAEVSFSALHFATDYIRREVERSLPTQFDLGNDKTAAARERKQQMISQIADGVLFPYLGV